MTSTRIITADQLAALNEAMARDTHCCYLPDFILHDDTGAIVGAFSIAYAPVLFFWIASDRRSPVGAMRAYRLAEKAMKEAGYARILLPCESRSPFRSYLPALGYEKLGDVELFEKAL
jgi:hypothetical protein